jgi:hypothetical protein
LSDRLKRARGFTRRPFRVSRIPRPAGALRLAALARRFALA